MSPESVDVLSIDMTPAEAAENMSLPVEVGLGGGGALARADDAWL